MYYAKQASEARSVQGVNSHKNSIAHVVKDFKYLHVQIDAHKITTKFNEKQ